MTILLSNVFVIVLTHIMVTYTSFISTIKKEKQKYVVPIPLDYTHKSLTPRLAFLYFFFS